MFLCKCAAISATSVTAGQCKLDAGDRVFFEVKCEQVSNKSHYMSVFFFLECAIAFALRFTVLSSSIIGDAGLSPRWIFPYGFGESIRSLSHQRLSLIQDRQGVLIASVQNSLLCSHLYGLEPAHQQEYASLSQTSSAASEWPFFAILRGERLSKPIIGKRQLQ